MGTISEMLDRQRAMQRRARIGALSRLAFNAVVLAATIITSAAALTYVALAWLAEGAMPV